MLKSEIRQRIDQFFCDRQKNARGTINDMMKFELKEVADHKVILTFPVEAWQLNPMGCMHGGMIAAAADIAMGCVSYVFSQANHAVTISMNIQYLQPVAAGIPIDVEAMIIHTGSRVIQVNAKMMQDQLLCASASGSFIINTHI